MKKLELNQMEGVNGGSCGGSLVGLGLTLAGAFFVATPAGAAVFAASFIYGSATLDC